MLLSFRDAMNIMHGLLFGGFFLLAIGGILATLLQRTLRPGDMLRSDRGHRTATALYTLAALAGWAAVFTGTYLMYPWYRAPLPAGTASTAEALAMHPKFKLLADPSTEYWHTIGMEWKEHIAFFAPIVITAVAFIAWRYRGNLTPALRKAVLVFTASALLCTGIAGFFGAMLDKLAPVEGGSTLTIVKPAVTK